MRPLNSPIAYFIAFGVIVFLCLLIGLALLAPEVDPLVQGISYYAHTPYGVLFTIAVGIVGVSGALLGLRLWERADSTGMKTGSFMLILWGFSSIAAGLFPTDSPGAQPSIAGRIHNLVGLNFLIIAFAVSMVNRSDTYAGLASAPRIKTVLTWGVVLSALLLFLFNGPFVSISLGGLFQRVYWLAICLWILLRVRSEMQMERGGNRSDSSGS